MYIKEILVLSCFSLGLSMVTRFCKCTVSKYEDWKLSQKVAEHDFESLQICSLQMSFNFTKFIKTKMIYNVGSFF